MQFLGELFSPLICNTRSSKHNHIRFNFNRHCIKKSIDAAYNQFAIFFIYSGDPSTDIINAIIFDCPSYKFFILLPSCPYIHIEYVRFSSVHFMLI